MNKAKISNRKVSFIMFVFFCMRMRQCRLIEIWLPSNDVHFSSVLNVGKLCNKTNFCCTFCLYSLDMKLFDWSDSYLWPKIAFKMSREFPTSYLDITQTGLHQANKPKLCNKRWVLKLLLGLSQCVRFFDIWPRSSFPVTVHASSVQMSAKHEDSPAYPL